MFALISDQPHMTAIIVPQEIASPGCSSNPGKGSAHSRGYAVVAMLNDAMNELITPPISAMSFLAVIWATGGPHPDRSQTGELVGPQQVLLSPS